MASSGVVKVILIFYRDDDQASAFEQHRGRVLFDTDKYKAMTKASRHFIDFMDIKEVKEQVEKFGLGAFDLKLFRLEKIEGKVNRLNFVPSGILFRILSSKRVWVDHTSPFRLNV